MRGVRESPFSDVQSLEEGAGKCRKRCSECASAGRFVPFIEVRHRLWIRLCRSSNCRTPRPGIVRWCEVVPSIEVRRILWKRLAVAVTTNVRDAPASHWSVCAVDCGTTYVRPPAEYRQWNRSYGTAVRCRRQD